MPHCIIECSENIGEKSDLNELIKRAYQGILNSNLFEKQDIKTRLLVFENYQIGDKRTDFIHITIKILSGRTIEQKKKLSKSILTEFENINIKPLSITIEVMEIETQSYEKKIYS